ncbi:hypothetical protein BUALT_Bualt05G0162800 [Buddleja alternifolia]|uniref:Uncharacterized protein n=1 Tax=Buddleja alternifolia TaxID=168488 RepID=A0AAV6XVG5_9LAMI|nr:hypothetical protein BUALT_Bualt05G0162800 [Buddleja alternifolia]
MAEGGGAQPLLSTVHGGDGSNIPKLEISSDEDDDIQPINGVTNIAREVCIELKKLLYLAGPAIFTSFCQYGLITITQIFAGHLGTIQLAAVSVENSIISGFPFGMMVCVCIYMYMCVCVYNSMLIFIALLSRVVFVV